MNTLTPADLQIIRAVPPVAQAADKVAIDSEWFGMSKKRLHRPHGDFACATFTYNGEVVYVVTDPLDLPQAFRNIEPAVHIYHNAKFDIGQFRRFVEYPHRARMWDTMLVEQVRFSGYYGDGEYALKDLARRYLKVFLPKEQREKFEQAFEMDEDMLGYAAVDCAVTWRIFDCQRQQIDANDLWVWRNIECPFTFFLLSMGGIPLDSIQWMEIAKRHQALADSIQAKYGVKKITIGPRGGHKESWEGINLASPEQVGDEIKKLGYDVPTTNEDDIKHLADQCPFVKDLLDYREHAKAASTYGEGILEYIEKDGRIYPDIRQMGAATGRPSMRSPNGQNIPSDKEHRACFTGEVLVDGDWSQQEPRIFAFLCGDEVMQEIYRQKKDIYIEFARLAFDWDIDKTDPRRKTRMKPTVLGVSYGLTPWGMQKKDGIPLEEGEKLVRAFFDTFPKSETWVKRQNKKTDYVETIYRRKYWLNTYQWGWKNNTQNSPVQGSAADAMKLACVRFNNAWGWPDRGLTTHDGFRFDTSPIINIVHDELVLEVPPEVVGLATQVLRKVMIEVAEEMHPGIPADVEIGTGPNWAEAHK